VVRELPFSTNATSESTAHSISFPDVRDNFGISQTLSKEPLHLPFGFVTKLRNTQTIVYGALFQLRMNLLNALYRSKATLVIGQVKISHADITQCHT
jgi:hypothetical protein